MESLGILCFNQFYLAAGWLIEHFPLANVFEKTTNNLSVLRHPLLVLLWALSSLSLIKAMMKRIGGGSLARCK